ncbi:MAG: ABC transporter permease [Chloroflexi bacterium]|nr:MAG: ABC transporter permease [Chloroflexota bacterium]
MALTMNPIRIVFEKECIDNLRDRRSISSVFLTALFIPLFVVVMVVVMGKFLNPDLSETIIQLPVVGAGNAPELVEFLRQAGVEILEPPADPRAAVQNGDQDIILVIPPEYGKDFTAGEPAELQLILDNTRMSASISVQRVKLTLSAYDQQVSAARLMARGINPQITQVLLVKDVDLSTPQSQSLLFLNMLPFLITMVIFMGGMYVVIDATAGERERGSLEPLLINPVLRRDFVLGKLFASLPFAIATLIFCLAVIGIAFNLVPLEQFTGFPMSVNLSSLWTIFWICLPMVLLASGLQMILASFTRSFKEAQTYLSFLPLVMGMPSAFLIFLPVKSNPGLMLIPSFSQGLLINQVMRGEAIDPVNVMISAAATLAFAVLAVVISIRLYQRETLLFGAK